MAVSRHRANCGRAAPNTIWPNAAIGGAAETVIHKLAHSPAQDFCFTVVATAQKENNTRALLHPPEGQKVNTDGNWEGPLSSALSNAAGRVCRRPAPFAPSCLCIAVRGASTSPLFCTPCSVSLAHCGTSMLKCTFFRNRGAVAKLLDSFENSRAELRWRDTTEASKEW